VATIVRYYVKSDLSICVLSNNSAVKIGQLMDDVLFLADASSPGLADVEKLYKMKATGEDAEGAAAPAKVSETLPCETFRKPFHRATFRAHLLQGGKDAKGAEKPVAKEEAKPAKGAKPTKTDASQIAEAEGKPALVTAVRSRVEDHMAELQKLSGSKKALTVETSPGAAVVMVKDGKVKVSAAYGMADIKNGVAASRSTVFDLGYVSKVITAVAVLQLVDAKTIDLDAPVKQYLPDLSSKFKTVKVHNLLHATSGIPDYCSSGHKERPQPQEMILTDLVAWVNKQEPDFQPGKVFAPVNVDYSLLALLVQQVSGIPYEYYVKEHVFSPLGMSATFSCGSKKAIPKVAKGQVLVSLHCVGYGRFA
jgi:CubicO group peptidase (beta-lactamase class C family)